MKHNELALLGSSMKGLRLPQAAADPINGQLAIRSGIPAVHADGQWNDLIEKYTPYDEYLLSLGPTFYARCRDNAADSVVANLANRSKPGVLKLVSRADGLTNAAASTRLDLTYADDRSFFFGGGRYVTVADGLPATFPAAGMAIFIHCRPTYNSSFASQTLFSTGQMEVRISNRSSTQYTFEIRVGSNVSAFSANLGTFGQVARWVINIRPGGTQVDIYDGGVSKISGSWWTGALLPVGTIHFGASLYSPTNPQFALMGQATRLAILPRQVTAAEMAELAKFNGT